MLRHSKVILSIILTLSILLGCIYMPVELAAATKPGSFELNGIVMSETEFDLFWEVSSNATSYVVERKKDGVDRFNRPYSYAAIATFDVSKAKYNTDGEIIYNDTNLIASTTYYYRIKACSSDPSIYTYSNEVHGKTANPETTPIPTVINTIKLTGFISASTLDVDKYGSVINAIQLKNETDAVILDIAKNAKLTSSTGQALSTLTLTVPTSTPNPPALSSILVAYDLGPNGAKFSPSLPLTLRYATLPYGADESKIKMAYWDGSNWVILPGALNTAARTVQANISHFSIYALLVGLFTPPKFVQSDLVITPAVTTVDKSVTVQTTIINTAELSGECDLVLKINGSDVETKTIALGSGQSEIVTFQVQRDAPGDYKVDLNDKSGTFKVVASAASVTVSPTNSPTIAGTTPANNNNNNPSSPLKWILLGIVIVLCLVIGVGIYNRRSKSLK